MDFTFKNTDGKIQALNFKIGDSWSEKSYDNTLLNSIFNKIDDGDGFVEESEINLLKKLLEKTDGLIKSHPRDKEISTEELQKINKLLKNNDIKLKNLELEALQDFDKAYYSLKKIRERYPDNKFEIEEICGDISVKNKATGKEILYLSQDKDGIYITEKDENGNEKLFRNFNKDGELRFYDKNGIRHNPIADMIYNSVSARTLFGLCTTSEDFLYNIMKISPQNAIDVAEYYQDCYGQSLEDAILEEYGLHKIIKYKALGHLEKCLSEAFGYKSDYYNNNSQISNKYYQGESYTVEQKRGNIIIKNNSNNKEYKLNLKNLISDFPLEERARLRAIIQKFPGEILADIAIELNSPLENINKAKYKLKNAVAKFSGGIIAAGTYYPMTNTITTSVQLNTLVHELGHAVDFNGKQNRSSIINNKEFKAFYKEEMANFIANGHTPYKVGKNRFENCYYREGGGTATSKYATYNENEMFAECYTLLMTGECNSSDLIEDFFPKTLQAVAKHIKNVRSLPPKVRN